MMNARQFCSISLALSSLMVAPAAVAEPLAYTVAVALPLDIPEAINNRGDFVGFNSATIRAFIYVDGVRTELGTFGGPISFAHGINNKGVVVGEAQLASGLSHAFVYYRGVMRDLGTLGGEFSAAFDINNAGQIVGYSWTAAGEVHAVLYSHGEMRDLGTLGGDSSVAEAINSKGQITGSSSLGPMELTHAFLYEKGVMRDIGTLEEFGVSFARDINDKGQIVGTSNGRAFLFTKRTGMVDLGMLEGDTTSSANAINNRGDIVGTSRTEDRSNAFLYTDGVMIDINTLVDPALGWQFSAAQDINARGQIVATGCNPDGCFGVRLDPVAASGDELEALLYSVAPCDLTASSAARRTKIRSFGN